MVPKNLNLNWLDEVKGQQSWQSHNIGDFVIIKSDGWPTYHLANVVDDHLMQISHVIRADEWLSSTPKHLYLFDCLGWTRPAYVHVPPVLNLYSGLKLSKRNKAPRVADLIKQGYLPPAVLNYLALLGWNPKTTQEIFSSQQLIEAFSLSQIQTSGARFDPKRLDWFNGRYLRYLSKSSRIQEAEKWWPPAANQFPPSYREKVLDLVYERLINWSELDDLTSFFFGHPPNPSMRKLQEVSRLNKNQILDILKKTTDEFQRSNFTIEDLKKRLYKLAVDNHLKVGFYFKIIRLKVTGREVAPGLFETLSVIGQKEVIKRLKV